jgi:transcriptional regulator with XRE-family HTH domain
LEIVMTLKQLRESVYLLQMEVAERLGVSPAAVSLWESGKRRPDLRNIREMAVVYAVTPDVVQQAVEETQARRGEESHNEWWESRSPQSEQ